MKQPKNKHVRVPHGTAVLEMSIVLLLLMYITLGAIEYGWIFLKQEQIANAAREGARLAVTPSATNATVTSEISTLMSGYGLTGKYSTPVFTPSDVSTASVGGTVAVNVSVPYSNIGLTKFSMLPLPTTLSATVTMEKEGP